MMASPADKAVAQSQVVEPTGDDLYKNTVNDLRSSLVCRVCFRLLCEPFTITCGHTFCYECLNQWFKNNKHKKTCPGCRAGVTYMPAQSYSIRDMVTVLSRDQRLLPPGDDMSEYERVREEMTALLEKHRKSKEGLFEGSFNVRERPRPLLDAETQLWHCPDDGHEIVDGVCSGCGMNYEHDSDDYSDSDSESTTSFSGRLPGHAALDLEAQVAEEAPRIGGMATRWLPMQRLHNRSVARLEREHRQERQLVSQLFPIDLQRQHDRAHARGISSHSALPLVVHETDLEDDEEDYSDESQDDISDLIDDGSDSADSSSEADDHAHDADLSDSDENGEVDYGSDSESDMEDRLEMNYLLNVQVRDVEDHANNRHTESNTPEPGPEVDSLGINDDNLGVNNFSDLEHVNEDASDSSSETDNTDDEGLSVSESSGSKSSPATHANAGSDGEDDIVIRQPRSRKRTRTVISSDSDDENISHHSERPSRQRRKAMESSDDSSDDEEDSKGSNRNQAKVDTGASSASRASNSLAASMAILSAVRTTRAVTISSDEDDDPIPATRPRTRPVNSLARRPTHELSQSSSRQEGDGLTSASRASITSGARA